jgi:hypothetical protein
MRKMLSVICHPSVIALQSMDELREQSYENRHQLEKAYKERLKAMDSRIKEVREKERRLAHMERLQQRSVQKCAQLQADIHKIKQQKVLEPLSFDSTLGCFGDHLLWLTSCRANLDDHQDNVFYELQKVTVYAWACMQVLLARHMEQHAKDFATWRKQREKELLQLKRQGRKQQMQAS